MMKFILGSVGCCFIIHKASRLKNIYSILHLQKGNLVFIMIFYFKPAQEEDIPKVFALLQEVFYPTYEKILSKEQMDWMLQHVFSEQSLKWQYKQKEFRFILLYVNEILAGFAVTEDAYDKRPRVCKLHKLYLQTQFQSRGWGRKLIAEAMSQARNAGQRTFILNVNRFNKACRFYKKLGFEVQESVDIPLDDGRYFMNDYVMGITL